MVLNIDEIRANYAKFPDERIEKIANSITADTDPRVVKIINEEIEKRGLNQVSVINQEKLVHASKEELINSINQGKKFHINLTTKLIITTVLIAMILIFWNIFRGGILDLIAKAFVVFNAITLVKMWFQNVLVAELKNESLTFSISDDVGFGRLARAVTLYKTALGMHKKVVVPFKQIQKIYREKNTIGTGEIIIAWKDQLGRDNEAKSWLSGMNKEELKNDFIKMLKMKNHSIKFDVYQ